MDWQTECGAKGAQSAATLEKRRDTRFSNRGKLAMQGELAIPIV